MIFQLKLCRGNSTQAKSVSSSNYTQCSKDLNQLFSAFSDVANVIQACYGESHPPIILIGHGVGGAIAVHTASNMLLPTTVGLVAIDVVEGKKASSE